MKNLIIALSILFGSLQMHANEINDLPNLVAYSVLDHGSHDEIIYTEEYDEEGTTMYEVRLKKKKHELILLIDEDGYVIETIKERYLD